MLIFHPASTEVKYSYYHALPPLALSRRPVRVLLYLHNCPQTQTYAELEAKIKDSEIPSILKLAEEYKYTLLAPVNPNLSSGISGYSDKTDEIFYDRPQTVVLKMVKNFLWILKVNGYISHPKVFILGYREQGSFANLFSIFYPEVVQAAAIGDADTYMYPSEKLKDNMLNYPYGTYDILKYQPNNYSQEIFKKIAHSIFHSVLNTSRIDNSESDTDVFIKNTFGSTQQERAENFAKFLTELGVEAQFREFGLNDTKEEIMTHCVKFFDTIKTPGY